MLLLNFCYFFSLYFVPLRLHLSIVFIDKIVQRAFFLVTIMFFLFATCLIFLNVGDVLATILLVYYAVTLVVFSLWRVIVRVTLKMYRRKGYNFKKIVIVGAGKNGMELYKVMKDDLSYGFNILGFFDDNQSLKSVLPNYLGMTNEVENFVLANDVDEIYCTLPGTNDEKIVRLLNFAEKHMIRFYIVPEFYRNLKKSPAPAASASLPPPPVRRETIKAAGIFGGVEEESCDGCFGVHPFDDRSPRAFTGSLQSSIETCV